MSAQILGVDALHTRDVRHTHRLLCKHILALRAIPILSHTKAVLIFESNLAFESQHLLHALEAAGIKNWVSLSEGQGGTLGWLTTHERKEQMCLLLREAMTVGRIAISRHFFSIEMEALEARKRIKDELLNFCVVTEVRRVSTRSSRARLFTRCAIARRRPRPRSARCGAPHARPARGLLTPVRARGWQVRKTYTGVRSSF